MNEYQGRIVFAGADCSRDVAIEPVNAERGALGNAKEPFVRVSFQREPGRKLISAA